jgi:hypothetical protein
MHAHVSIEIGKLSTPLFGRGGPAGEVKGEVKEQKKKKKKVKQTRENVVCRSSFI